MPFSDDQTFSPPFPRLPVVLALPENGARSHALSGLVDTGTDATLAPTVQHVAQVGNLRHRYA